MTAVALGAAALYALTVNHPFPADGTYTLKVFSVNLGNKGNFRPFGEIRGELSYFDATRVQQVDGDKALHAGARPAATADESGRGGELRTMDLKWPIKAGSHKIRVTLLATHAAPSLGAPADIDTLAHFYASMGNSNQHLRYDVPAVLVGGANGRLKGGRQLAYAAKTSPTGKLLLPIFGMFDFKAVYFGDSTGRLVNI